MPTTICRTTTLTVAILAAACSLPGCAKDRPLHVIHSDALFALDHGNYASAKADLATYVERRPDEPQARYEYALALLGMHEPRPAAEQLNICLDVDPLNDRYVEAQARALYEAGDRERLIEILARNCSERGRVRDYLLRAKYSQLLGNLDEAKEALKTAAKLDRGTTVKPQRALADFYASIGDREKQIARLRMAYFIQPDDPELLAEIRRVGEIPGPSFGLRPEEAMP